MEKVRIDQWLWSVRIFKSRSLATKACKSGKVSIADSNAKPSQMVRKGDTVKVKKDGFNLTFEIVELIRKRVSAALAAPCYKNLTPEEELNKYKDWYVGKAQSEMRDKGSGRPTKRERREINEYKEEIWDYDFDEYEDD